MTDHDMSQNEGFIDQLGQLTTMVSKHDETISNLKEVPLLLRELVNSMKPQDNHGESSEVEENQDPNNVDRQDHDPNYDGDDLYRNLGFEDTQEGKI